MKAMVAFYRDLIGLTVQSETADMASLGAGESVLLTLQRDSHATLRSPDMPGLFHTAFLLPKRADLGAWLHHAMNIQAPLEGLSDHIVSEAAYISDPEGNGVEIYHDRPKATWITADGTVKMGTMRMDVQSVLNEALKPVSSTYVAPSSTLIGHVHLSVGELREAGVVLGDIIGMKKKASYPQADFYASGDYHHHIAANTWHLEQQKTYTRGYTGLDHVTLEVTDSTEREALASRLLEGTGRKDGSLITFDGPSNIPFALDLK
jgi:catechol 2,3-dioxygenase